MKRRYNVYAFASPEDYFMTVKKEFSDHLTENLTEMTEALHKWAEYNTR
jgi:hypothetical protein